jgi:hypothetical protein
VNAVAIMYVNDHLEGIRADARQHRAASLAPRRSLRARMAAGGNGLRRILGGDSTGSVVPKLTNYPYGG